MHFVLLKEVNAGQTGFTSITLICATEQLPQTAHNIRFFISTLNIYDKKTYYAQS